MLTTLQALMGDYAMQAPLSMLVDRKRDATPYDLADLPGRRLVAEPRPTKSVIWPKG